MTRSFLPLLPLVLLHLIRCATAQCNGSSLSLTASSLGSKTLTFTILPENSTNLRCEWVITKEATGKDVAITFRHFDLQDSEYCVADSLTAYVDGPSEPLSKVMGRWCGITVVRLFQVPKVRLVLTTDNYSPSRGFSLEYEVVFSDRMDGSIITFSHPILWYSYRYAAFLVGDNVREAVTFVAPQSTIVQVEVLHNDLVTCSSLEQTRICGLNPYAMFVRGSSSSMPLTYNQQLAHGDGIALLVYPRSPDDTVTLGNCSLHINATDEPTLFESSYFRYDCNDTWQWEIEAVSGEVLVLRAIQPAVDQYTSPDVSFSLDSDGALAIEGEKTYLSVLPRLTVSGINRINISMAVPWLPYFLKTFTENTTSMLDLTAVFAKSFAVLDFSVTPAVRLTSLDAEAFHWVEILPFPVDTSSHPGTWTLKEGHDGSGSEVAPLPSVSGETTRYRSGSRYLVLQSPQRTGRVLLQYMLVWGCRSGVLQRVVSEGTSEGFLYSPDYPFSYYTNTSCSWRLTAERPGAHVRLVLENVTLADPAACLHIHDGSDANASSLGRLCGVTSQRQPPENWISTGHDLFVTFAPGSSGGQSGLFRLSYSFFGQPLCNEDLSVTSPDWKTWSTPGYPDYYANSLLCQMRFTSSAGEAITVEVTDSDIADYEPACSYDVASANDSQGAQLGRWCNSSRPNFTAPGALSLSFVSNSSVTGRGFSLQYKQGCPGDGVVNVQGNGSIASPQYPKSFVRGVHCRWVLMSLNGFTLTFDDVTFSGDCSENNVTVYDGSDETSRVVAVWCTGRNTPSNITGQGNSLTVVMSSSQATGSSSDRVKLSYSVSNSGFWDTACRSGQSLSAGPTPAYIRSDNYPHVIDAALTSGLACEWRITAPSGSHVFLKVTDLYLYVPSDPLACKAASFSVFDGFSTSAPLIGSFCANDKPIYEFKSEGSALALRLHSSTYLQQLKFEIQYYSTTDQRPIRGCGSRFRLNEEAVISSPSIPPPSSNPTVCAWWVSGEGQFVSLESVTFNLPESEGCSSAYLKVYDGWTHRDATLGTFCGSQKVQSLSTGPYMALYFYLDSSVQNAAFSIRLTRTSDPLQCKPGQIVDVTVTEVPVYLKSPNYPRDYPNNTDCSWRIQSSDPSKRLKLKTIAVDMQDYCEDDYLEITDGRSLEGDKLATVCRSREATVLSSGSTLFLHFRSDSGDQGKGFLVQIFLDDEPISAASSGVIAGAVLGTLIPVALIAVVVVLFIRWRRTGKSPIPWSRGTNFSANGARSRDGHQGNQIPMTNMREPEITPDP